jgi:hypothetical protein
MKKLSDVQKRADLVGWQLREREDGKIYIDMGVPDGYSERCYEIADGVDAASLDVEDCIQFCRDTGQPVDDRPWWKIW